MILVYEGPFIYMLIAMIIVYIAYKKDQKKQKEFEKSIKEKELETGAELPSISIDYKKDELLKDYLNSYNYKKVAL